MPLQNCGQWNEHCPHLSEILSATFDHYRWLLRPAFNLHVYLPFLRTAAIVNGYMPLSKWILSPSFRVLSVTFDHYHWLLRLASIFIETYTITWNARYRQLVNTIMLMNTLAILRGTFGNFRPLSLTTSACVNLHILNLPLLRKRAMVNAEMPLQIAFSEMNTLPIFRGYSRQLFTTIVDFFGLR